MRFTLRRYLILISTLLAAAASAAPAALPAALTPTKPGGSPLPVQLQQPLPVTPTIVPQTPIAMHFPWLTHGLAGLFVLAAVSLVFLLAIQTTKQEGLTGSIGGRVSADYRGRLGSEEQLKRVTGVAAVVFVVAAFILSLTGI
jgi:protein translocase SecG subunit